MARLQMRSVSTLLLAVLLAALALVACGGVPIHRRFGRPGHPAEPRALVETEAAHAHAHASASQLAVGQVVNDPNEAWQIALAHCKGRCGHFVLVQLYEELFVKPMVSAWPSSDGTPGLRAGTQARATAYRKKWDIPPGQLVPPNADALQERYDEAKAEYDAIPLTKAGVEARVDKIVKKDWTQAAGVQGVQHNKVEETLVTPRFTYRYTAGAQLQSVEGFVIHGPGTDPKDQGMCAALWSFENRVQPPDGPTDINSFKAWPALDKSVNRPPQAVLDVGHIVAASLGGSNNKLINFMPQIGFSNRGAFAKAEAVAQDVRDWFANSGSRRSPVHIRIEFAYDSERSLVPTRGLYIVVWDPYATAALIHRPTHHQCRFEVHWLNPHQQVILKSHVAQVKAIANDYHDHAPQEPEPRFFGTDINVCTAQLQTVRRWAQLNDARKLFADRQEKQAAVPAAVHEGYPTPQFNPAAVRPPPVIQAQPMQRPPMQRP